MLDNGEERMEMAIRGWKGGNLERENGIFGEEKRVMMRNGQNMSELVRYG